MRLSAAVGVIVGNGGIFQDFCTVCVKLALQDFYVFAHSIFLLSACVIVAQSRRERWRTAPIFLKTKRSVLDTAYQKTLLSVTPL